LWTDTATPTVDSILEDIQAVPTGQGWNSHYAAQKRHYQILFDKIVHVNDFHPALLRIRRPIHKVLDFGASMNRLYAFAIGDVAASYLPTVIWNFRTRYTDA